MNGQDVKCRRDAHCGQIRQTRRTMANGRHYLPTRNRARNAIRTRDTRFRRAVLYPLSYQGEQPDIIHMPMHPAQPCVAVPVVMRVGKISRADDACASFAALVWNTSAHHARRTRGVGGRPPGTAASAAHAKYRKGKGDV